MTAFEIIPLQELIIMRGAEEAHALLSVFKCSHDPDIENFLHNRAIDFENIAKARTYLLCDADKMKLGEFVIMGYFALSLKVLILPEEMSIRSRKEYDGFSGKIHGQPVREIPCYLIGQLARDDNTDRTSLPGSVIINSAMSVIEPSFRIAGGRWVIIECHNTQQLIDFYEKNAFKFIMDRPSRPSPSDEEIPMVQMIRKLV